MNIPVDEISIYTTNKLESIMGIPVNLCESQDCFQIRHVLSLRICGGQFSERSQDMMETNVLRQQLAILLVERPGKNA